MASPCHCGRLHDRLVALLDQAAVYLRKFDASRAGDPSDDRGDQFSYGVAAGLLSAVAVAAAPPQTIGLRRIDVRSWVASGCPTDPHMFNDAAETMIQ